MVFKVYTGVHENYFSAHKTYGVQKILFRAHEIKFETYTRYSLAADEKQKKTVFLRKSYSRHYEKIVYWSAHNFYFVVWNAQTLFSLKTTGIVYNSFKT